MTLGTRSLEEIAQEFHRIRSQKNGRPHFPKELWKAAFDLTATYSLAEVASALGISPQYLKKRLGQDKGITQNFAQARLLPTDSHSFIEITLKHQAGPLTLRWTGPIKDLPALVGKLFRGEFS